MKAVPLRPGEDHGRVPSAWRSVSRPWYSASRVAQVISAKIEPECRSRTAPERSSLGRWRVCFGSLESDNASVQCPRSWDSIRGWSAPGNRIQRGIKAARPGRGHETDEQPKLGMTITAGSIGNMSRRNCFATGRTASESLPILRHIEWLAGHG